MDKKANKTQLLRYDYAFAVRQLAQSNSLVRELQKENERLRTVEQAYQALLSATAGQQK